MSIAGIQEFEPDWTWQSEAYDRNLILEKECCYFVDAFLNLYLGMDVSFEDLEPDFAQLADKTLRYAFWVSCTVIFSPETS